MKKIYYLLIPILGVVLTSNSLPDSKKVHDVNAYSGDSDVSYPDSNNYSRSDRSARDAKTKDPFRTAITRMQMISRVVGGIVVQKTINKGFASSDVIIAELLRMGSLRPSTVGQLNETTIGKALDAIEAVVTGMDDKNTISVQNIENLFLNTAALKELADDVGNFTDWSDEADFKFDLNTLNASKEINETLFKKFNDVFSKSGDRMEEIADSQNDEVIIKGALKFLKKTLDTIPSIVQEIQNTSTLKYEKIKSAVDAFFVIGRAAESITRATAFGIDSLDRITRNDEKESSDKNFQLLFDASTDINAGFSDLKAIGDLFGSRTKLVETVAIPNGLDDLKLVGNDLTDSWLNDALRTKEVAVALKQLDSFESAVSVVKRSFDQLGSRRERAHLASFDDYGRRILDVFSDSERIKSAANYFFSCQTSQPFDNPKAEAVQLTQFSVMKVDESVRNLNLYIERLVDLIKTRQKSLEEFGSKCQEYSEKSGPLLKKTVQRLLESDNAKTFLEVVTEGQELLKNIKIEHGNARTAAKDVIEQFDKIDYFRKHLGVFSNYFKCIRKGEDVDLLTKTVRLLQQIRDLRGNSNFATQKKIVGDLKGSQSDFRKMGEKFGDFKSGDKQSKMLLMGNIEGAAEVVGPATEVVVKMSEVLDMNLVFDTEWIRLVDRERKKVVRMKASDEENLEKIRSIAAEIQRMNAELSDWKEAVRQPMEPSFAAYAKLFEQTTVGVDIDFLQLRESVERLQNALPITNSSTKSKRASKYDLKELKAELSKLASLGLRFKDHRNQLSSAPLSLQSLDSVVAKFLEVTQPSGNSTGSNGHQGSSNVAGGSADAITSTSASSTTDAAAANAISEAATKKSNKGVIIGVSIAAVLLLLVVIGVVVWWKCFRGKKVKPTSQKNNKKTNSSNSNGSNSLKEQDTQSATLSELGTPRPRVLVMASQSALRYVRELFSHILRTQALAAKKRVFLSPENAFPKMCKAIMSAVDTETFIPDPGDPQKGHEREIRVPGQILHPETAVTLEKTKEFPAPFYHANHVTMPNNLKMILAQAPQAETANCVDTIGTFNLMIMQQKAEFVVMLCNLVENDSNKCDQYFADEKSVTTFPNGKVECRNAVPACNGEVMIRAQRLTIGKETHYYKQIHYTAWPDHSAPQTPDTVLWILRTIRESRFPVVVHCSAGIGRSGSLAFIEFGYQTIAQANGELNLSYNLIQLRKMRGGAIQEPIQLAFCAIAIMEYVLEERKEQNEACEKRDELLQFYVNSYHKEKKEKTTTTVEKSKKKKTEEATKTEEPKVKPKVKPKKKELPGRKRNPNIYLDWEDFVTQCEEDEDPEPQVPPEAPEASGEM